MILVRYSSFWNTIYYKTPYNVRELASNKNAQVAIGMNRMRDDFSVLQNFFVLSEYVKQGDYFDV